MNKSEAEALVRKCLQSINPNTDFNTETGEILEAAPMQEIAEEAPKKKSRK